MTLPKGDSPKIDVIVNEVTVVTLVRRDNTSNLICDRGGNEVTQVDSRQS